MMVSPLHKGNECLGNKTQDPNAQPNGQTAQIQLSDGTPVIENTSVEYISPSQTTEPSISIAQIASDHSTQPLIGTTTTTETSNEQPHAVSSTDTKTYLNVLSSNQNHNLDTILENSADIPPMSSAHTVNKTGYLTPLNAIVSSTVDSSQMTVQTISIARPTLDDAKLQELQSHAIPKTST